MKNIPVVVLLALLFSLSSITAQFWHFGRNVPSRTPARTATPDIDTESFSIDMFSSIARALRGRDANFVIAPFSVWSLMVLVSEGADGQSLSELSRVLHLPRDASTQRRSYRNVQRQTFVNTSSIELTASQAIFSDVNRPVKIDYAQILEHEYQADHIPVNFADSIKAAKTINDHISLRTQGKIRDVIKPNDLAEAQLLLTSNVLFKGQWKFPFNESKTTEQPFFSQNGEYLAHVPMMYQRSVFAEKVINALDASVLELPYGNDERWSMLLILPRPNTTLTTVFDNLKKFKISQIHHELHKHDGTEDYDDSEISLSLPRFTIDSDFELRTVLEDIGITDIFDPEKSNLSKISNFPTYISRVFQKTVIEVNEVGTVAAATTIATAPFRQAPIEYVYNRPFGFLIINKMTKALIFAGQVSNPLV